MPTQYGVLQKVVGEIDPLRAPNLDWVSQTFKYVHLANYTFS
jgi:hypothetical protein